MTHHRWTIGLRAIAIVEVLKGGAVLVATAMVASSSWTMVSFMELITRYMHLKQEGRISHFFNDTVAHLPPGVLIWLALAYGRRARPASQHGETSLTFERRRAPPPLESILLERMNPQKLG